MLAQRGGADAEALVGGDEGSSLTNIQTSAIFQQPLGRQSADFRNDRAFPPFWSLPEENSISLDFYTSPDGFNYFPERHWCFLAEVVSVEDFLRLRLIVRDKSGATVPIAFYTDGRGTEFADKVQPGNTVAILYAIQHGFLDFTTGIRLEDCSGIKVEPLLLVCLFQVLIR